jgi:hypothetical protein
MAGQLRRIVGSGKATAATPAVTVPNQMDMWNSLTLEQKFAFLNAAKQDDSVKSEFSRARAPRKTAADKMKACEIMINSWKQEAEGKGSDVPPVILRTLDKWLGATPATRTRLSTEAKAELAEAIVTAVKKSKKAGISIKELSELSEFNGNVQTVRNLLGYVEAEGLAKFSKKDDPSHSGKGKPAKLYTIG